MTTRLTNTKHDDVVKLRRGMEMVLREGVIRGNVFDDTEYIRKALNRISTYDGYAIETKLKASLMIDDRVYPVGRNVTTVKEDGRVIFAIYQDRTDFVTKLYVDPFDLMYSHELADTERAELNAILMKGEWNFQWEELKNRIDRIRKVFDARYFED